MTTPSTYHLRWPGLTEIDGPRPASGERVAAGPIYGPSYTAYDDSGVVQGCATLLEMFERSVGLFGDRPCLGHRPIDADGMPGAYVFATYAETAATVHDVAAAYTDMGLGSGDKIGIIGQNSPQWMIAMLGINQISGVCVPLYDTLGDTAVQYIITHAETKVVIAQGAKLASIAAALAATNKVVTKGVVYWGDADAAVVEKIKASGVDVMPWADLVARGAGSSGARAPARPSADSLCTIMYTSGTTGDPKGVMITHKSVVASIGGLLRYLEHLGEKLGPEDVYLSYLPLAHIFDRLVEELFIFLGGSIAFFQGDARKVLDDVGACRPTVFVGVPRVFDRIYAGIQNQIHSGSFIVRTIFKWAYTRKLFFMNHGWKHNKASVISDMLVFNKIKQKLGGRVRVIVSGGAPMSTVIETFLRVAMCAPVVQGYGLTETCAASFVASPWRMDHVGTVGPPLHHTLLRLEAVPEMGYDPMDDPPAGEICIKGPGVFSSYYKNEAMTKESVDDEGFFHTGDIGKLVADGSLQIVDRKKNIFKLSHGEYVAVEKLEDTYKHAAGVEQVWVYGSSQENFLVAVVVPTHAVCTKWASEKGVPDDVEALCKDPAFVQNMLESLQAAGKAGKVKGYEAFKAGGIHLEPHQFSVEEELVTATFKLRRPQLQKKYQKQIDAMYAVLNAPASK